MYNIDDIVCHIAYDELFTIIGISEDSEAPPTHSNILYTCIGNKSGTTKLFYHGTHTLQKV